MRIKAFSPLALMLISIQLALVPDAMAEHRVHDPCTDGRASDGKPRSCSELRRALRHSDRPDRRDLNDERPTRRFGIDPCSDGRFSDATP